MLKPTFVNTANGEPLTANRGLKFVVDCENAKLNVSNMLNGVLGTVSCSSSGVLMVTSSSS